MEVVQSVTMLWRRRILDLVTGPSAASLCAVTITRFQTWVKDTSTYSVYLLRTSTVLGNHSTWRTQLSPSILGVSSGVFLVVLSFFIDWFWFRYIIVHTSKLICSYRAELSLMFHLITVFLESVFMTILTEKNTTIFIVVLTASITFPVGTHLNTWAKLEKLIKK